MGLRIISGSLRGKKLHPIKGTAIRPTADRLRESIFNIISSKVQDAVVLDLFAGTGALGIEALSRGAGFAVFIDNYKVALSVISQNNRLCALADRTKIIKYNIIKNLNCIKSAAPAFNLVFLDPPYNKNLIKPAMNNLLSSRCLEKNACIMVEHSRLEPIPEDLPGFLLSDQRKYGRTMVSFLNYKEQKNLVTIS